MTDTAAPLRPWIVCSCGNLISIGDRTMLVAGREVREHPACGREPNRIGIQPIPKGDAWTLKPPRRDRRETDRE